MGLLSKVKRAVKKVFKAPKKLAQKLVPKEAAGIMQMAAPFLGPVAGPITYGLGSLKQRGKISPLGMALTMAPHIAWSKRGMPVGYDKWGLGRYSSTGDLGAISTRDLLFGGRNRVYNVNEEGILGGPGEWLEKKLWGKMPVRRLAGEPFSEQMGGFLSKYVEPGTSGWLGAEGVAGTLTGTRGLEALKASKLAGALLGKEGDLAGKGVSTLKAVSWGSAIVGGIQAGKFKDAQEAAQAAEDAARADGITDEEWIINARSEAEEYWNNWRATTTFKQGGRVGYNTGQLVRPGPERMGYAGDDPYKLAETLMDIENVNDRLDAYIKIVGPEFGSINELARQFGDSEMVGFLLKFDQPELKLPTGAAQGGRVGYQFGVGPVGGIGAMAPQLPMMQQPMHQPMQSQMQTPPPKEGGLGRLPIEADMRYTGGFMPYGETEKADDVPARLSKNEFVFTADAVKAAGGGSVNKGAKKLYDTMKQLEAMS